MIYNSHQVIQKLNEATRKSYTILLFWTTCSLVPAKLLLVLIQTKFLFVNESFSDMNCAEALPRVKIYINESLTYTNRQKFNKCLQFKKQNNWPYIWTQNGATLLTKNSQSDIVATKSNLDLQKLK